METKLEDLITPEAREAVEKLAQQSGKPFAEALSELVVRGAGLSESGVDSSRQEQEAAWQELLAATAEWSKDLPKGTVVDDGRESIYSGRGE